MYSCKWAAISYLQLFRGGWKKWISLFHSIWFCLIFRTKNRCFWALQSFILIYLKKKKKNEKFVNQDQNHSKESATYIYIFILYHKWKHFFFQNFPLHFSKIWEWFLTKQKTCQLLTTLFSTMQNRYLGQYFRKLFSHTRKKQKNYKKNYIRLIHATKMEINEPNSNFFSSISALQIFYISNISGNLIKTKEKW